MRIVGRRGQYPVATLAYYGPDNTRATKLVVSVLRRARDQDGTLHRWITQAGDIRRDTTITAEVEAFLERHGVKQRVITKRIIGCPHEEGKDYPDGGVCPHCPFWQHRNRFTHELLLSPPEMTPADILSDLDRVHYHQPRSAIIAADAHREVLVEPLLRGIERGLLDASKPSIENQWHFAFAAYLLARWREPRAFPGFVRWLSLPGEGASDLGGDMATEVGGKFLALVCGGSLAPIKDLIVNLEANEYCRGQAVIALSLLAAWGEVPHREVTDYFAWLAREGLEREYSNVWDNLVTAAVAIEARDAFPDLRGAFDEGLVDAMVVPETALDEVENSPPGTFLAKFRESHPPAVDVLVETAQWIYFDSESDSAPDPEWPCAEDASSEGFPQSLPRSPWATSPPPITEPFRAPPKVGRNDPCPCGSGKKFKKCCGQ